MGRMFYEAVEETLGVEADVKIEPEGDGQDKTRTETGQPGQKCPAGAGLMW